MPVRRQSYPQLRCAPGQPKPYSHAASAVRFLKRMQLPRRRLLLDALTRGATAAAAAARKATAARKHSCRWHAERHRTYCEIPQTHTSSAPEAAFGRPQARSGSVVRSRRRQHSAGAVRTHAPHAKPPTTPAPPRLRSRDPPNACIFRAGSCIWTSSGKMRQPGADRDVGGRGSTLRQQVMPPVRQRQAGQQQVVLPSQEQRPRRAPIGLRQQRLHPGADGGG
jgi:hypothetical protein